MKWKHNLEQKKVLRAKLLKEFESPILDGKKKYSPEPEEVEQYKKRLRFLSLKKLREFDGFKKYDIKLDIFDRLKSIKKKKFSVVTIFMDNKTTDTGVCQSYNRSFTRGKMRYLIMPERGIYNPERSIKMMHFYYYANQPFPIAFNKPPNPENMPDARLLNDTIENGVIEALASLDMSSIAKMALVASVLTFIVSVFILILMLRSSGFLG